MAIHATSLPAIAPACGVRTVGGRSPGRSLPSGREGDSSPTNVSLSLYPKGIREKALSDTKTNLFTRHFFSRRKTNTYATVDLVS